MYSAKAVTVLQDTVPSQRPGFDYRTIRIDRAVDDSGALILYSLRLHEFSPVSYNSINGPIATHLCVGGWTMGLEAAVPRDIVSTPTRNTSKCNSNDSFNRRTNRRVFHPSLLATSR